LTLDMHGTDGRSREKRSISWILGTGRKKERPNALTHGRPKQTTIRCDTVAVELQQQATGGDQWPPIGESPLLFRPNPGASFSGGSGEW
jgi:hypothetical protein